MELYDKFKKKHRGVPHHLQSKLLSILGKQFQDAGLRDLCVESGVIVEGSVADVIGDRMYTRAAWCHVLVCKTLRRRAWKGLSRINKHNKVNDHNGNRLLTMLCFYP